MSTLSWRQQHAAEHFRLARSVDAVRQAPGRAGDFERLPCPVAPAGRREQHAIARNVQALREILERLQCAYPSADVNPKRDPSARMPPPVSPRCYMNRRYTHSRDDTPPAVTLPVPRLMLWKSRCGTDAATTTPRTEMVRASPRGLLRRTRFTYRLSHPNS